MVFLFLFAVLVGNVHFLQGNGHSKRKRQD